MRVASNMRALQHARCDGMDVEFITLAPRRPSLLSPVKRFWSALWADYVVINSATRDLFELCLLRMIVPFSRCKVVSVDSVLPEHPTDTLRSRIALGLKRLLFRQVHLFIEYFRETGGYERCYAMPRHKFRYVPFKINRYEKVLRTVGHDDGYIFCGGNTHRDFATLLEAVRGLDYPVKIVTMKESIISGHGSSLDERNLPPNVQVIRHDGSDSFLEYVAGARLAVLPIKARTISASGIGVYLVCMALGKPVVISSGPAVNGVVPGGAAVIVAPEDPASLREAIVRLMADDDLRRRVAEAGREYALPLGGEQRLCESILRVIAEDVGALRRQYAASAAPV